MIASHPPTVPPRPTSKPPSAVSSKPLTTGPANHGARSSTPPPLPLRLAESDVETIPMAAARSPAIDAEVVQLLIRSSVEEALAPIQATLAEVMRRLDEVDRRHPSLIPRGSKPFAPGAAAIAPVAAVSSPAPSRPPAAPTISPPLAVTPRTPAPPVTPAPAATTPAPAPATMPPLAVVPHADSRPAVAPAAPKLAARDLPPDWDGVQRKKRVLIGVSASVVVTVGALLVAMSGSSAH